MERQSRLEDEQAILDEIEAEAQAEAEAEALMAEGEDEAFMAEGEAFMAAEEQEQKEVEEALPSPKKLDSLDKPDND